MNTINFGVDDEVEIIFDRKNIEIIIKNKK